MTDRTVVVTGASSGLGYEAARSILAADRSWHVVVASQNEERASAAVAALRQQTENREVTAVPLDLASLDSVRAFAHEIRGRGLPPLRALICNAGIQVVSGTTHTRDDFEATFGVNHVGHFLLANLLLRQLVSPARIVVVASGVHDPAKRTGMPRPRFEDARRLAWPEDEPDGKADVIGRRRYATSKLCNVLCAYELDRRLRQAADPGSAQVTVNAFDPGMMPGSGLARDYAAWQRLAWRFVLPLLRFVAPNVNSTKRSGRALGRLVLDPALETVSGRYFQGTRDIPSSEESHDLAKAGQLWEGSAELVGLTTDESPLC